MKIAGFHPVLEVVGLGGRFLGGLLGRRVGHHPHDQLAHVALPWPEVPDRRIHLDLREAHVHQGALHLELRLLARSCRGAATCFRNSFKELEQQGFKVF